MIKNLEAKIEAIQDLGEFVKITTGVNDDVAFDIVTTIYRAGYIHALNVERDKEN